ncbi:hypothetical protein [Nonomuraea sediminis]|uniref:hypothetical protein n=1 Tax=Nonomuraea sediminis TaxID=2835864 RepID=UPI001BDD0E3F|nr:hypothetical protein [Nonomuraea sediminis]
MNPDELRALIREVLREVLAEQGIKAGLRPPGEVDRPPGPQAVHRIERGAVTERHVNAAAKAGAKLVLGPRAVLTPLARDRIRATGVTVERED